jgi:hypothetical protein
MSPAAAGRTRPPPAGSAPPRPPPRRCRPRPPEPGQSPSQKRLRNVRLSIRLRLMSIWRAARWNMRGCAPGCCEAEENCPHLRAAAALRHRLRRAGGGRTCTRRGPESSSGLAGAPDKRPSLQLPKRLRQRAPNTTRDQNPARASPGGGASASASACFTLGPLRPCDAPHWHAPIAAAAAPQDRASRPARRGADRGRRRRPCARGVAREPPAPRRRCSSPRSAPAAPGTLLRPRQPAQLLGRGSQL